MNELGEQGSDVAGARKRLMDFLDLIDEQVGESWVALDDFSPDKNYLSPGEFVEVMQMVGFRRNQGPSVTYEKVPEAQPCRWMR